MNKTILDKLDKLLASYGEGRKGIWGLRYMTPTQAWLVDKDRFDNVEKWNELYHLCKKARFHRIRWGTIEDDCNFE